MLSKWILFAAVLFLAALSVVIAQQPSDGAAPVAVPEVAPPTPPVAAAPPAIPVPPTPAIPGVAPAAPAAPAIAVPPPTPQPAPVQPRKGRSGKSAEPPAEQTVGTVTMIIRLKNSQANSLLEMLRSLMDDRELGTIRTAVDAVSNTLILRGDPKEIEVVHKMIVQIDDESIASTATTGRRATVTVGPNAANRTAAMTPQLADFTAVRPAIGMDAKSSQEYYKLEAQAAEAARAFRQGAETLGAEHPQQRERREQLGKLVEKAFDVRQDGQNQELKQLKERITKVEQSISKRAQNRSQIIEKRLKDLLNDEQELDWNAGAQTTPTIVKSGGATVYGVSSDPNGVVYGNAGLQFAPAGLPGVPGVQPSGTIQVQPGVQPGVPIYSAQPHSLPPPVAVPRAVQTVISESGISQPAGSIQRQLLSAAVESVLQKQAEVDGWKGRLKAEELKTNLNYEHAQIELQSARRQLERTKQEFDAQLKLLQLDVDAARAEVEAAQQELDSQSQLAKDGTVPTSALAKSRAQALHAEIKLKKAATLLDLHRFALKSLEDSTTTGASAGPKR